MSPRTATTAASGGVGVQLDLFGQVQAGLEAAAARQAVATEVERRARFHDDGTPVTWTAPYDCAAARKGQTVEGWRCWLCGQVEVNAYVLGLNHGLHQHDQGTLTRTTCARQDLLASQARARIQRDIRATERAAESAQEDQGEDGDAASVVQLTPRRRRATGSSQARTSGRTRRTVAPTTASGEGAS